MLVSSSMILHDLASARAKDTWWGLVLVSGTRPTSDQLRNLVYGAFQRYRSDLAFLNAFAGSLGGKVTLRMYSGITAVTELSETQYKVRTGEVAAKGVSLFSDPPTWGMLHVDLVANSDAFEGHRAIYFTVGDENSDADVKIQGGYIPKGSEWKPNDFTINFAGVV